MVNSTPGNKKLTKVRLLTATSEQRISSLLGLLIALSKPVITRHPSLLHLQASEVIYILALVLKSHAKLLHRICIGTSAQLRVTVQP